MGPNFIIIGAARSGTTSLAKYLGSIEGVSIPEVKELNFFSNPKYWSRGVSWYESQFFSLSGNIFGEASTSYTNAPGILNVPKNIYEYNKNIKLIYLVRDPIERLKSHYFHKIYRGEEERSLTELLKNYGDDHLIWQGMYYYQISKYLEYFELENILVVDNVSLNKNPEKEMERILIFLNYDINLKNYSFSRKHNKNKIIRRKNKIGMCILKLYHSNLEQKNIPYFIKKQIIAFAEIFSTKIENEKINEIDLVKLKKVYSQDVEKFSRLFNIKLKYWPNFSNIN